MTSPFKESKHLSIPFQNIIEATKNFTDVIGRGGYGCVYKGQLSISGEVTTVAVKRLLKDNISGQGLKEFLTEIHLLSRLKHPNLVSLLGFCQEGDEKVLIYEYAHKGSLDKFLTLPKTPCPLTWKQRLHICIDAAQGLDYLHNGIAQHDRIIHRDIKSSNILLDNNMKAMISDLGLSKKGRANEMETYLITSISGTHGYCDPAYISTGILTKESDIYSFGVVLFEVLCGRLYFIDVSNEQRFLTFLAKKYFKEQKLDDIVDPGLKNQVDSNSLYTFLKIAYECLHKDRGTRPPIATVVHTLKNALKFQENVEKGPSSVNNEAYTARDELYKHSSKKVNVNKGNVLFSVDDNENNQEIKSEVTLFQENWIPISLPDSWDQDVPMSNQSNLRVSNDNNLLVKCFSVIKKLLENNGGGFEDSYIKHWVDVVELFKEVSDRNEDASGRVLYESVSCITIVISRVAQGLRASLATKHAEVATKGLQEILDHAKASCVINTLLSCLVTCGTSLMSGSSKMLRAACEAFEAIWSLIDAFEIQSTKENAHEFPLRSMYSHSVDQLNIKDDECEPLISEDSEKIVETVTQEFLRSEALQVAVFYCLRQRLEASWSSVIQIILRCCLHNKSVASVLCGVSSSSVVSGGGDNTIVSEVFSIISLCASFNRDPQPGDTNNLKSKVSDPSALVLHSCFLVTSVAQSLESAQSFQLAGRRTATVILTSSPKVQESRLSDLAHHYSLCDRIHNFQPHSISAMLALASILNLESYTLTRNSIAEISIPLIPSSAALCDYLRVITTDAQGDKPSKIMLSYWYGFRDGCVRLLAYRLKWDWPLAIQDLGASNIFQILIDLLENKHSDEIRLSPLGVVWTLFSLFNLFQAGISIFRQMLLTMEHVKVLCGLISDVHLKLIRCWGGPGGGTNGVRDTVYNVLGILSFPFEASVDSYGIHYMESHDREVMVEEIKTSMEKYIQILLEVGLPGQIIKCLGHLELKDTAISVDLLSKMVVHRSLVVELLGKGLLNPNLMKRLLDDSSPTEVKVDVLDIVSKIAEMDEEFYEHIDGADILQQLKAFLTHDEPSVRAWTCGAIADMCWHSSYFYSLLAKHNIISLLVDLLFDEDNYPQQVAVFAIKCTVRHSDLFYEDLRICIPQLANLLLSPETTNPTKTDAATCFNNLSYHSDKLIQDMISKGGMEALLKVVADCALDPSRIDANNESLLYEALYALGTMCKHQPCRKFIGSSDVYPVIGQLRESPVENIASYATLIFNRVSET